MDNFSSIRIEDSQLSILLGVAVVPVTGDFVLVLEITDITAVDPVPVSYTCTLADSGLLEDEFGVTIDAGTLHRLFENGRVSMRIVKESIVLTINRLGHPTETRTFSVNHSSGDLTAVTNTIDRARSQT